MHRFKNSLTALAGLSLIGVITLVIAGCASKQENSNGASSSAPSNQAVAGNAAKPGPGAATPATKGEETTDGRPIEFTYLGITSDKQNISYRIKVNTEKRISQVDLAVKEMDDSGKVLMDTTTLWQNIVKSVRQPIEKGKTYDVQDYLYPGATKADVKLKRIVFEDSSTWSPK